MLKLTLKGSELLSREDLPAENHVEIGNSRDLLNDPVDFAEIDVISLHFPAFKDGRAFTQARELREQGFEGDIRATGGIFSDQLSFAVRCGFTSFDIETPYSVEELQVLLGRFSHVYQRPGTQPLAWEVRS